MEKPSYEDYLANGSHTIGCGDSVASGVMFFSFVIVVILAFMNLFIAIIIQGYEDNTQKSHKVFS